jgi:branched-chain amino acid transport system substrate-binding protein
MEGSKKHRHSPSRRAVIKGIGAGLAASTLGMPAIARAQSAGTIKIGLVTPATGPLALFGDADGWTVGKVKELLKSGLETSTGRFDVDILVRDSQSNPNRAGEVAGDLILNDKVHLLVPASTTDTVNPSADQAELYECPSLSSGAPWQAAIFPRGGKDKPFKWTYHFFWGLMLFPQNADGETFGNNDYGLPAPTKKAGFEIVVPGFFQPRTNDYTAQITAFKQAGCEIVGGITYPDDLRTFMNQCAQQGFKPKAVTVAAALLFAPGVQALGPIGDGVSTEVWWTPAFPFKSTLTGQLSKDIADQWESETKKQWTQPLGFETLVGKVDFSSGPHPNISTTPIFGGQWVKGTKWPCDLRIVDNTVNKLFTPEQHMKLMTWST